MYLRNSQCQEIPIVRKAFLPNKIKLLYKELNFIYQSWDPWFGP